MSENELIWTPFQLPHHCSSQMCMHTYFFLQKNLFANAVQQSFLTSFTKASVWFLTGLANINSRGLFSPVILIPQWLLAADWVACGSHYSHFRAAQDITSSSLHVYKRRRKHRSSTCLSVYLTPSAFHNVAHAQLLHFLCPCGLPLMKKRAPWLHRFFRAAVFTSHWSSGNRDSLAGWHRLLSCHWQEAPVAPYAQASALTLFMLWHTL